jgi:hypothetical protein
MGNLDAIVQVTITSASRGLSRRSFGVPLVIAKHTEFAPRFKEYAMGTALSSMVTDGFATTSPAYRAVQAVARNTPKPEKVVVGKLLTSFDQDFDITVKTITAIGGELFAFTVVSPDGTETAISYTAIAADDEDVIATALATQLTAIANLTAPAPIANEINCSADNSDEMFLVKGLDTTLLDFADVTADSSLVTELTQITDQYSDWYGLILADPNSSARIQVLAADIETQERIFGATTHDTACGDAVSTTDVAYVLKAANYFRTFALFSGDQGSNAAATWMGAIFPFDPGSATWSYKPLSGVVVDSLSAGFISALKGKNCNYYVTIAGAAVSRQGKMAAGEWIDVIRGRDWLKVRMQERIFGLLINAPKVPFTDAGIDQVTNEVRAQLDEGIGNDYLSPDSLDGLDVPYTVTAPAAGEVSSANKIARTLPDVDFEAQLAGAIHVVQISGSIQA